MLWLAWACVQPSLPISGPKALELSYRCSCSVLGRNPKFLRDTGKSWVFCCEITEYKATEALYKQVLLAYSVLPDLYIVLLKM